MDSAVAYDALDQVVFTLDTQATPVEALLRRRQNGQKSRRT
jgi:hypothetical protein